MSKLQGNKNRIFLRLISLIVLQVFIFTGVVYLEPYKKDIYSLYIPVLEHKNRYLRVPAGIKEERLEEAIKKQKNIIIVKLNIEFYNQTKTLTEMFKNCLQPLENGEVTIKRIKKLLSPNEKKIFSLIQKMRENRIRKTVLEGDLTYYKGLQISDSPDCGLCYYIAECFIAAIKSLKLKGLSVEQFSSKRPSKDLMHSFVLLRVGFGVRIVIDGASGQVIKKNKGRFAIAPFDEYYIKIMKAISKIETEKQKLIIKNRELIQKFKEDTSREHLLILKSLKISSRSL